MCARRVHGHAHARHARSDDARARHAHDDARARRAHGHDDVHVRHGRGHDAHARDNRKYSPDRDHDGDGDVHAHHDEPSLPSSVPPPNLSHLRSSQECPSLQEPPTAS